MNGYNINNLDFEVRWRRLTHAQRRFVTHYHEHNSKRECAEALGLSPATVYGWGDDVWEVAEMYQDHITEAAVAKLAEALGRAVEVKVEGLDSENEVVKQKASTEIIDRNIGKPKQTTEVTGEGGGPIPVQFVKLGGIDPDDI